MSKGEKSYGKRVLVTAAIYTAAAWAAVEALLTVVDRFGLPAWWATLITALFVAGLPVTVYMVWRTAGVERRASMASIIGSAGFLIAATAGIFWFTQPAPQFEQRTVAIVPCDFQGETDHAYRAVGLAEDVHARLSRVDAVRISSWNSSLFVRDKGYGPGQIAEVLHVDRLVQCSMKSNPERIELSAKLIDPVANTTLWNHNYDFAIADLGTVVTELASTLLDILATPVEAEEMERVTDLGTFSPEAYDLHLQARAAGDVDIAESLVARALAIDANYAEAMVFHASLYLQRAVAQEFEDMSEPYAWVKKARVLSQRALDLDPGVLYARHHLVSVCALLGGYYNEKCPTGETGRLREEECKVRGDTAEGWACWHEFLASRNEDNTKALDHWLELEPTSTDANMEYMGVLWATEDRRDQALAVFDTMRALEPDDLRVYGLISNLLRVEGRLDEVLAWRYSVFRDQMPEGPWRLARLGTDYMNLGLYQQAAEIGLQTWKKRRASATHFMPILWARQGETERAAEAMEWLARTLVTASGSPGGGLQTASFYARTLRNFERAKEMYDEALANKTLNELCDGSDECMIGLPLELAHLESALGQEEEAAAWLAIAEKATGQTQAIEGRLEVLLRVAQGRHEEAVGLLRDGIFAWQADPDLTFPIYFLEDDAMLDPLREKSEFQQLLDDYNAYLEPMRQRVVEAEQTGDWNALRQHTYQWAADGAE
jgi:TolB-like protein